MLRSSGRRPYATPLSVSFFFLLLLLVSSPAQCKLRMYIHAYAVDVDTVCCTCIPAGLLLCIYMLSWAPAASEVGRLR